jgi:hypothetical protein
MQVICVNINSTFLYNGIVKKLIDMKGKVHDMEQAGTTEVVPGHMMLPNLQEILMMRPSPTTPNDNDDDQDDNQNDITKFTFVAEYLVGAVICKKEWDRYKCHDRLSTNFAPSDKAYLYVVSTNHTAYGKMWRGQEWALEVSQKMELTRNIAAGHKKGFKCTTIS